MLQWLKQIRSQLHLTAGAVTEHCCGLLWALRSTAPAAGAVFSHTPYTEIGLYIPVVHPCLEVVVYPTSATPFRSAQLSGFNSLTNQNARTPSLGPISHKVDGLGAITVSDTVTETLGAFFILTGLNWAVPSRSFLPTG